MVFRSRVVALASCTIAMAACLLLAPADSARSQELLDFRRIEVSYPRISLAFKVTCDSTFRRDMTPQQFEVRENGVLMKNVTLWCPPEQTCCVSASLVFDRSGSMLGTKMTRLKAGAVSFLKQMNPDGRPCDEASVVSFEEFYTVDTPMTSDTATIGRAIRNMEAWGRTSLWDATGEGIRQLARAKNLCRAVVVLSDGADNASTELPFVDDVIRYAHAARVKVFTIGYGLVPDSPEEQDLRKLAQSTGGQYYYTATGLDFAAIYSAIKQHIQEAYRECLISYDSNCPDGTVRAVELTLKNYCNAPTTRKILTYTAPYDPKQFKTVRLTLGSAEGQGSREVVVPVTLADPVDGVFSRGDFTVVYDRRYAQLVSVSTVGTLFEGMSFGTRDIGSGHTIIIPEHREINGAGVIAWLRFRLADIVTPQQVQLWLYNWNMAAYCLTPMLLNGQLTIHPRTAELSCDLMAPDSLMWNDDLRDYDANPFTVEARVANTGTRDGTNLQARIIVPAGFELVSPTAATQAVTPLNLPPGATGTVMWTVRALGRERPDTSRICIEITANNHPPIQCCRDIPTASRTAPALVCTITAPDTVYFREQYYEPEIFDVGVEAVNTGDGKAHDVAAQLMQDTRFTIMGDAVADLSPVLAPAATAGGSFRVRMHPRTTDGYDTLRVNVQGSDTDPAWCLRPVYVERVRAPRFTLACTTPDDQLAFDEGSGDYTPNPFTVTTIAENVGETYADECELMFVGPPRFTPVAGNLRPLGTMRIADTRTEQWLVRALPRAVGGWDTLHFQVLGRGGLGRAIVVADCRLPIYVPAMRAPAYELACEAPSALTFERGAYVPDPFTLTLTVRNTGTSTGRALRPAVVLPQGVALAAGETSVRTVDSLAPGAETRLVWRLSPALRSTDGIARLCVRLADSIGVTGECCSDVAIPRATAPRLALTCRAPDSLYLDPVTGAYLGNPFDLVLTIANSGSAVAENVVVDLAALGAGMQLPAPTVRTVGDLAPGASTDVRWSVRALPRLTGATVPFEARAQADNHGEATCTRSVYVPARLVPELTVQGASVPEDSVFFDWSVGDFSPTDVRVQGRVRNTGGARALGVSALLLTPANFLLADGETALKSVAPAELDPGQEGTVSWRVRPLRDDANLLRDFRITARADNAAQAECTDPIWVQGSPSVVTLWIDRNHLFRFGQKGLIPIRIDRTIGKDLSSYDFELEYDASVLTVHGLTSEGTLTSIGWTGPRMTELAPGRIRLSDYTTTSPLRADTGVLVQLRVEGLLRGRSGLEIGATDLTFKPHAGSLNNGAIWGQWIHGVAWVTGDCIVPLVAGEGFLLKQNHPNPFNPTSIIGYQLPVADHVRLTVHDATGRELRVLDEGLRDAGSYDVRVDATGLRSGTYFYRLVTSRFTAVRAMIVTR
jgi:uncharacterized protein YegL